MLSYRQLFAAGVATLALFALVQPASAATVMEFPDNATLQGQVELQAYNFRSAPPVARRAKSCLAADFVVGLDVRLAGFGTGSGG